MIDVSIIGIGQTPVGEHWERPLRYLGAEAILAALADAGLERPEALYVGNMLGARISQQQNLGALLADHAGLRGTEAVTVEAACASGAAALRLAYLAVAGGLHDVVVACGVEKMTDAGGEAVTSALMAAADATYEGEQGLSFVSLNALLMQRYMHTYGCRREDFGPFAINAHANAVGNPNAMFRREVTPEAFASARIIATPVSLLDSAAIADGAAAVVLAPTAMARTHGLPAVRIAGSATAGDSVALHDRRDPLWLQAAEVSAQRAYAQAGIGPETLDFAELHDAFTIMTALALEADGLAPRGGGVRLAMEGEITPQGRIPLSTMGGLKARGHPVGASGLYQVVEAVLQLRGAAGPCQLPGCRLGMTQSVGGSGATVVTHILERI